MDPLLIFIISVFIWIILGVILGVLWSRSKKHEKKIEEIYEWHKLVNQHIKEIKEKM